MRTPYDVATGIVDGIWGDRGLPVDPEYLCHNILITRGSPDAITKHQIRVEHIDLIKDTDDKGDTLSGCALFDVETDEFVVKYNPTESPNRQRFTISHELGHVVLGHVKPSQPKKDRALVYDKMDKDEIAANQFAAEIVIPYKLLKQYVYEEGFYRAGDLARLFGVSEQAMYYRMKNLGIL
ncbi:ImmA/IrrE family metallo-endopeptidase [Halomonas alkaliantarctica]|nr:ImmA/IrrE family metallo-endopeptidase [Halomonas alkaliantarctica]